MNFETFHSEVFSLFFRSLLLMMMMVVVAMVLLSMLLLFFLKKIYTNISTIYSIKCLCMLAKCIQINSRMNDKIVLERYHQFYWTKIYNKLIVWCQHQTNYKMRFALVSKTIIRPYFSSHLFKSNEINNVVFWTLYANFQLRLFWAVRYVLPTFDHVIYINIDVKRIVAVHRILWNCLSLNIVYANNIRVVLNLTILLTKSRVCGRTLAPANSPIVAFCKCWSIYGLSIYRKIVCKHFCYL